MTTGSEATLPVTAEGMREFLRKHGWKFHPGSWLTEEWWTRGGLHFTNGGRGLRAAVDATLDDIERAKRMEALNG